MTESIGSYLARVQKLRSLSRTSRDVHQLMVELIDYRPDAGLHERHGELIYVLNELQNAIDTIRAELQKNCRACRHCYMEPSDMGLVCGHPDSGQFGQYLHRGIPEHCGAELEKFEQHPLRTASGALRDAKEKAP